MSSIHVYVLWKKIIYYHSKKFFSIKEVKKHKLISPLPKRIFHLLTQICYFSFYFSCCNQTEARVYYYFCTIIHIKSPFFSILGHNHVLNIKIINKYYFLNYCYCQSRKSIANIVYVYICLYIMFQV